MKQILIFSTNVSSTREMGAIQRVLSTLPGIKKWTIDLQDSDKVLRVVSWRVSARDVESLIQSVGLRCLQMT